MELATKAIHSLRGSRFDVSALVRAVAAVRAIMVATRAEHNAQRDSAKPAPAPIVQHSTADSSVALPVAHRITHEPIAEEVDNRIGQFAHQPPVRVRDSAFGALPVVAFDERVSGAVYESDIYLFRNVLPDLREVQRTLFHELLHYGLQRYVPKEKYITRMMSLYQRGAYFRFEADRWAKGEQGQLAAVGAGWLVDSTGLGRHRQSDAKSIADALGWSWRRSHVRIGASALFVISACTLIGPLLVQIYCRGGPIWRQRRAGRSFYWMQGRTSAVAKIAVGDGCIFRAERVAAAGDFRCLVGRGSSEFLVSVACFQMRSSAGGW
jgi:hypothetical protein